jgi:NAD-dependent dihydropyrimidine dehydrogenase PreA subunit
MPTVITDACTKDMKCVEICPADCIHPRTDEPNYESEKQLFVDPDGCPDCGSCIAVCEFEAVYELDELPDDKKEFAEINAAHYRK